MSFESDQPKIYLGLVHHPIMNKRGDIVTTSVTNLDIHDIARSCRTFGMEKYFIITPLTAQHELVNRILGHWESDTANAYNPDRQDALKDAFLQNSIEDAKKTILDETGQEPFVAVTGANFKEYSGGTNDLCAKLKIDKRPCLLLFGTGWGLPALVVDAADYKLSPIFGASKDGYNHLSVRSAVAIYLDRLRRPSGP